VLFGKVPVLPTCTLARVVQVLVRTCTPKSYFEFFLFTKNFLPSRTTGTLVLYSSTFKVPPVLVVLLVQGPIERHYAGRSLLPRSLETELAFSEYEY
jgi:hypothetical protein